MSAEEILFEAEETMEKSVDYMIHEFSSVRTGKASPALVENVDVHAYGDRRKVTNSTPITTPELCRYRLGPALCADRSTRSSSSQSRISSAPSVHVRQVIRTQ